MSLAEAIKAHQKGNQKLAFEKYQEEIQHSNYSPVLFQNFGALLRELGKNDKAIQIYKQGVDLYPNHCGILDNYCNILSTRNPACALHLKISSLRVKVLESRPLKLDDYRFILETLDNFGFYAWLFNSARYLLALVGPTPCILIFMYKASIKMSKTYSRDIDFQFQALNLAIENCLNDASLIDKAEFNFAKSWVFTDLGDNITAKSLMEEARKFLSLIPSDDTDNIDKANHLNNVNSWNFGCTLLTDQDFSNGWKFFEYGLNSGRVSETARLSNPS